MMSHILVFILFLCSFSCLNVYASNECETLDNDLLIENFWFSAGENENLLSYHKNKKFKDFAVHLSRSERKLKNISVSFEKEIEEKSVDYLYIKIVSPTGNCYEKQFQIPKALKYCKDERFTFYISDNSLSIIGENVELIRNEIISTSSICGKVSIDTNKNITSSILHALSSSPGLKIQNSQIGNTVLRASEAEEKWSNTFIKDSTIAGATFLGSVKIDNATTSDNFSMRGNVICKSINCWFAKDPCSENGLQGKIHSGGSVSIDQNVDYFHWLDYYSVKINRGDYCSTEVSSREKFFYGSEDISSYSDIDPKWLQPTISYVGCTFDGKISKSLYRYSHPSSNWTNYQETRFRVLSTSFFCASGADNQLSTADQTVAISFPNASVGGSTPEYFSLRGYPFCYKYKQFLTEFNYRTNRIIGDLETKYEECSDCKPGQVKIGNSCSCPEGTVETDRGCETPAKCYSEWEYKWGKCECSGGSVPYKVYGPKGVAYYCSPPLIPNNDIDFTRDIDGEASISVNIGDCTVDPTNGGPIFPVEIDLTNNRDPDGPRFSVTAEVFCKEAFHKDFMSGSISGKGTTTAYPGETVNGTQLIYANGECYKYKVLVMDGNTIKEEVDITLPYPHCGQEPLPKIRKDLIKSSRNFNL